MNEISNHTYDGAELERLLPPPEEAPVWNDHDRLPTGGAWLYVTDQESLDQRRHVGSWVPADLGAHEVAMVVSSAVGESVARADLVVIDQVGLEPMVDEDCFVPEGWQR